jgi:hypothetical protein
MRKSFSWLICKIEVTLQSCKDIKIFCAGIFLEIEDCEGGYLFIWLNTVLVFTYHLIILVSDEHNSLGGFACDLYLAVAQSDLRPGSSDIFLRILPDPPITDHVTIWYVTESEILILSLNKDKHLGLFIWALPPNHS